MDLPASSWLFLCLALAGIAMTATALMALTANDARLQPGFTDVDTSVAAAVPFFILHGTHDSLASVEEARHFAQQLRAVSKSAVVYAELPGAQYAWDVFRSVRAMESVHAVTRFLEWVRATRPRAPADESPTD